MRQPVGVSLTQWIRQLAKEGRLYLFYNSPEWKALRAEVLEDSHHECQLCLQRGNYTRAQTVHHINEVLKKPWLALSKTYEDKDGVHPNLVALCNRCHNEVHDRWKGSIPKPKGFTNEERW